MTQPDRSDTLEAAARELIAAYDQWDEYLVSIGVQPEARGRVRLDAAVRQLENELVKRGADKPTPPAREARPR